MRDPGALLEHTLRQIEKRRELRLKSFRGGFLVPTIHPETGKPFVCNNKNATVEILQHARRLGHITDDQTLADLLTVVAERDAEGLKTDKLTEMPNMSSFNETIGGAFQELKNSQLEAVVVIALDLNKFKTINDKYGHLAGDKALQAFANRLKTVVRANEYPFRRSGDEFAMILKIKDPAESTDEAIQRTFKSIRERINKDLSINIQLRGEKIEIPIESAMGYSVVQKGEAITPNEAFHQADIMATQSKGPNAR